MTTPALPTNPLADAMERATGEVLTANQRAYLSSLTGGMEGAVEEVVKAFPYNTGKVGADSIRKMLEAAAPYLRAEGAEENQRLREAVKEAYREGWRAFLTDGPTDQSRGSTWEMCWQTSEARAALAEGREP